MLALPLAQRALVVALAAVVGPKVLKLGVFRRGGNRLSLLKQRDLIAEVRAAVPPPPARVLGGERMSAETYERFLRAVDWNVPKATANLKTDLKWRAKYQPRLLRFRMEREREKNENTGGDKTMRGGD